MPGSVVAGIRLYGNAREETVGVRAMPAHNLISYVLMASVGSVMFAQSRGRTLAVVALPVPGAPIALNSIIVAGGGLARRTRNDKPESRENLPRQRVPIAI